MLVRAIGGRSNHEGIESCCVHIAVILLILVSISATTAMCMLKQSLVPMGIVNLVVLSFVRKQMTTKNEIIEKRRKFSQSGNMPAYRYDLLEALWQLSSHGPRCAPERYRQMIAEPVTRNFLAAALKSLRHDGYLLPEDVDKVIEILEKN